MGVQRGEERGGGRDEGAISAWGAVWAGSRPAYAPGNPQPEALSVLP